MLRLETMRPEQHFTEPPPRYYGSHAGERTGRKRHRPASTYASIISTIVEREYVTKDQGRFTPTMLGEKVSELLVKSFEDIFDVGFTARMEEELDEIEEGKLPWRESVKEFYQRFEQDLDTPRDEMESYKAGIPTGTEVREMRRGRIARAHQPARLFPGLLALSRLRFYPGPFAGASGRRPGETRAEACDNCGREMVIKRGRWGPFLACTGYPDCKTTRRLVAGTRRGAPARRTAR